MQSKYPAFDRSRLVVKPLLERDHDMDLGYLLALEEQVGQPDRKLRDSLRTVAEHLVTGGPEARILMMGAHVIKSGVSRQVIDLLRRGAFTHVAMNGAGAIHDFELARIGATTESVARYIRTGEFGLWDQTGILNEWAVDAARLGLGLGENFGRLTLQERLPHRDVSILAVAYELGIPVTVHVGIGYDITHEHPNCDGGAYGQASYRDFLVYTKSVESLEGGIMVSLGSAIMGPEVYLKALAMARNVARQEGRRIADFTTAVLDLVPIQGDIHSELPKSDPGYYFRPHKTILVRTVADGGRSLYLRGDHRITVPALRKEVLALSSGAGR
ncbi:MAG: hypothetical protein OXN89_01585 [Bryobacterales bacterium]|nr:hypothetical protein [Bryobacterales bacterium]